jgi:hypothetical protein
VACAGTGIIALAFPPCVVKAPTIEIGPVVSFEIRPVVGVVYPIAIVTAPGRIVIIDITGEFGFAGCGRGIVPAIICGIVVNRCGRRVDRCGRRVNGGRSNIHPDAGEADTDMGVYIYLRIAFGSDEAGGQSGGDEHYLFHICRF